MPTVTSTGPPTIIAAAYEVRLIMGKFYVFEANMKSLEQVAIEKELEKLKADYQARNLRIAQALKAKDPKIWLTPTEREAQIRANLAKNKKSQAAKP
jgi:hypothetical protein